MEFVGVSGVGKTSLIERLITDRHADIDLVTRNEFLNHGLAKQETDEDRLSAISMLFDRIVEWLPTIDRDLATTLFLTRFYFSILSRELQIGSDSQRHRIVFDEGVVQIFGQLLSPLAETHQELTQHLVGNRLLIHCTAPLDVIAERTLRRRDAGDPRFGFDHLKGDDLLREIHAASSRAVSKVAAMRNIGIPCLTLDLSAPYEDLVPTLRSFLHEHR